MLLVDRILVLASETDPLKGPISEASKSHKAWQALVHMSEISQTLSGWALNHHAGLSLRGLSHARPASSEEMRKNPEYQSHLEQINSHANEETGRACDLAELEPSSARRVLAACLRANPAGIDSKLNARFISALTALDFGEVLDLLQADPAPYRKARWQELQHQLRAVALIEYRRQLGQTKLNAQKEVAAAFVVSPDAIRRWEAAVRKELGTLAVGNAVEDAKNSALLEEEAAQGSPNPFAPSGFWNEMYGASALRHAGKEYQEYSRLKKERALQARGL